MPLTLPQCRCVVVAAIMAIGTKPDQSKVPSTTTRVGSPSPAAVFTDRLFFAAVFRPRALFAAAVFDFGASTEGAGVAG